MLLRNLICIIFGLYPQNKAVSPLVSKCSPAISSTVESIEMEKACKLRHINGHFYKWKKKLCWEMMVKNITYLPQSKLAIYYQESANLGVSCEASEGS